jgi:hypothetical protein
VGHALCAATPDHRRQIATSEIEFQELLYHSGQFGSKQALVAEALAQHSFYLDRPQKHSAAPRTEGV